jgi:surface polysaccharide O-acyltransferase-like enzyme
VQYSTDGLVFFIEEFFSQGLNRIASPLFFIISGYLFFANINDIPADFIRKLKKRVRTLVVPYLIWSLVGLFIYWALQLHPLANVFFTKTLIRDLDFSELLYNIILASVPYQLWYIRDLTVFVLLSPLFYILIKRLGLILLLSSFVFWILEFNFFVFRNQSLFFYILGSNLALNYKKFSLSQSRIKSYPFVIIWISVVFIKTILFYFNLAEPDLLKLFHKVGIVSGILAINFLYDNLYVITVSQIEKLKPLFVYSFFIFASHEPLLTIIKKSMLHFTGNNSLGMFTVYILAPVFTIFCCLITAQTMRRYIPRFYSVFTGGR